MPRRRLPPTGVARLREGVRGATHRSRLDLCERPVERRSGQHKLLSPDGEVRHLSPTHTSPPPAAFPSDPSSRPAPALAASCTLTGSTPTQRRSPRSSGRARRSPHPARPRDGTTGSCPTPSTPTIGHFSRTSTSLSGSRKRSVSVRHAASQPCHPPFPTSWPAHHASPPVYSRNVNRSGTPHALLPLHQAVDSRAAPRGARGRAAHCGRPHDVDRHRHRLRIVSYLVDRVRRHLEEALTLLVGRHGFERHPVSDLPPSLKLAHPRAFPGPPSP